MEKIWKILMLNNLLGQELPKAAFILKFSSFQVQKRNASFSKGIFYNLIYQIPCLYCGCIQVAKLLGTCTFLVLTYN